MPVDSGQETRLLSRAAFFFKMDSLKSYKVGMHSPLIKKYWPVMNDPEQMPRDITNSREMQSSECGGAEPGGV
jgi:hypothetical protein